MNAGERREIKAEVLMKAFGRFCQEEANRQKVSNSKVDAFLVTCVERMAALANRVEKAGVKP